MRYNINIKSQSKLINVFHGQELRAPSNISVLLPGDTSLSNCIIYNYYLTLVLSNVLDSVIHLTDSVLDLLHSDVQGCHEKQTETKQNEAQEVKME